MKQLIKAKASPLRSMERLTRDEARGQRAICLRASDSCQVAHRRISERKANKWIAVRSNTKDAEMKKVRGELVSPKTMSIKVQLPPGLIEHSVRKFDVPEDKTVGMIEDKLAERFGVEKGQWRLYGSINGGSKLLKRNEPIKKYDIENITLYFYPEY